MATHVQIVFDCADPDRLASFWAKALQYKLEDPPQGYTSWEDWLREHGIPEEEWNRASAIVDPDGAGPRIYFQRVPEPKQVKNRVHLDLSPSVRGTPREERRRQAEAEVKRLTSLGARELYRKEEHASYWITMADPEGNEFCLH